MIAVLEFVAAPVAVALIPAAIATWQMRLRLAGALALASIALTLGAPAAIAMLGVIPARPAMTTVELLAAIVLVWPLALICFAVGMLALFQRAAKSRSE